MSQKDYSHQTPAVEALEKKLLDEHCEPSHVEELLAARKNADPTAKSKLNAISGASLKSHPLYANPTTSPDNTPRHG